MAAYIIAELEITDPEAFDEYRAGVPETIEKYGGTYLARGGAIETAEGDWSPKRLVILRFESMARAKEWHASEDYRDLKALRQRSANTNLIMVEGV